MEKLLTGVELSAILGVHPNTIRRWKNKGLPYVIVNGRPRYISVDVIEWVNKNSFKS